MAKKCALRLRRALLAAVCIAVLPVAPAPARDEVLRIGQTTEPNSLSPLLALNDYEQFVDRLMFDVLVTVDANGRTLLPRLAAQVPTLKNGGISQDGLTLTYHLRRNVTWHDGVPFTSADVRFSYDAVMNPQNNVANRHGYDTVRSVATPDAYTVVFHMKRPYAPAVTNLFSDAAPNPILPRHLLARYANLNRVPFNQAPIGTGPYKFLRWDHGQSVELVANDRYYLGKPKIERVSVRFVPDETTMIDQLRTHELDVFSQASVNAFGQIRRLSAVKVALVNFHGASNVLINTSRPDLRDVRVRRAIASAIDKRAIVERFAYGAGKVASADLPDFMWAHDPHLRGPGYDPEGARRLLGEAGWKPRPDGVVAKSGRPLTLVFAFAQNNAAARLIAVQLQSYLRAVGLDVQLKGYNAAMLFAGMAAGGIYQSGNFDLAWYTMSLGIDPDSSGRFMCDAVPPNGQNYSRYCSKAMDAAQTEGRSHLDRATRKRAYAKSQRLLIDDVPIVFVYWPMNIEAYDPRLRGFAPNPVTDAWNAQEWAWR